jgi:hypothetical protein
MREASDVNLQRSVLPGLKAIGIGSGQFGGRRAGVLGGQALGDLAAALSREESGLRSAGFKTALDAALREQGQQTGAANALTNLGQTEFQSKLEAPLTRAMNAAQILRGYNYPTTTTETYKGPANVYGPSPLSQIAGLGTLLGAAFPAGGQGFGDRALGTLRDLFGAGAGNISEAELANLSNQAKLDLIGLGDLPPSFGGTGATSSEYYDPDNP